MTLKHVGRTYAPMPRGVVSIKCYWLAADAVEADMGVSVRLGVVVMYSNSFEKATLAS